MSPWGSWPGRCAGEGWRPPGRWRGPWRPPWRCRSKGGTGACRRRGCGPGCSGRRASPGGRPSRWICPPRWGPRWRSGPAQGPAVPVPAARRWRRDVWSAWGAPVPTYYYICTICCGKSFLVYYITNEAKCLW